MSTQLRFAARVAALAVMGALVDPAAAITCRDGTQNVQGTWMATPYCQDVLLVQVARARGLPASLEKIRNNNNYKKEVCRVVFTDIRVTDTCLNAGIPEYRH